MKRLEKSNIALNNLSIVDLTPIIQFLFRDFAPTIKATSNKID